MLFNLICTFLFLFSFSVKANAGTFESDSYARYMPSRAVDAQPGRVTVTEAVSKSSYEFKACDKLPVKFSLETEYIGIKNTTVVKLPSHLTGVSGDFETTLPFFNFEKTYLRFGLSPSFYTDDWNFRSSAFRFLSRYYLIKQPNEKWTFIAGVAVYPDYERQVLPILGFIYAPGNKWEFHIVPKRPYVSYLLNEKTTLLLRGGSSFNREYEVAKDGQKNVILSYKESRIGPGIMYQANKFTQVFLSAGAVFNRSLKYRDSLGKVNIKSGAYTEFRVDIKI